MVILYEANRAKKLRDVLLAKGLGEESAIIL
jgi:hypothetical protein